MYALKVCNFVGAFVVVFVIATTIVLSQHHDISGYYLRNPGKIVSFRLYTRKEF